MKNVHTLLQYEVKHGQKLQEHFPTRQLPKCAYFLFYKMNEFLFYFIKVLRVSMTIYARRHGSSIIPDW